MISVERLQKNYTVFQRRGLTRKRKIIRALQDISFTVKRGEFLGYIGPNGAGKSTTIKILTGIMTPDSGQVRVNNMTPYRERRKYVRGIGVVFGQKTQLWWDLPVKDTYALLKEIYAVPKDTFNRQLKTLREYLTLDEIIEQPVRQLSLGQRMRAELGAAMIHDPGILFLDEPTIGLDVISKQKVLEFLKVLHETGKTIFLTTHDLKDIETLCEEVLVINSGTLVYKGKLQGLRDMARLPKTLRAKLAENSPSPDIAINGSLAKYNLRHDPASGSIHVELEGSSNHALVVKELMQNLDIVDFRITDPSIEEIVRYIYTNKMPSNCG